MKPWHIHAAPGAPAQSAAATHGLSAAIASINNAADQPFGTLPSFQDPGWHSVDDTLRQFQAFILVRKNTALACRSVFHLAGEMRSPAGRAIYRGSVAAARHVPPGSGRRRQLDGERVVLGLCGRARVARAPSEADIPTVPPGDVIVQRAEANAADEDAARNSQPHRDLHWP
jgi:hypothetical protein